MADKINPKLVEIREQLIDAVHEGLRDDKQRNKASFLNVAVSLLKMHGGPEELRTEDEIKAGIEAIRSTYIGVTLPFLSNGQPNPDFKPKEQPAPVVPSVLLDQDGDSDEESRDF
jgi:hypothetical protein